MLYSLVKLMPIKSDLATVEAKVIIYIYKTLYACTLTLYMHTLNRNDTLCSLTHNLSLVTVVCVITYTVCVVHWLCVLYVQVDRSKALLASLADEKERWEAGSETFKSQMSTISGDVLLTSAFMAYGGH